MWKTSFNTSQTVPVANAGYELLWSTTVSWAASATISVTIAAKNNLYVRIFVPSTDTAAFGTYIVNMNFNNDVGLNYWHKYAENWASLSWANSVSAIKIVNWNIGATAGSNSLMLEFTIANRVSTRKFWRMTGSRMYLWTDWYSVDWVFTWNNTADQITEIDLTLPGSEKFSIWSYIEVFWQN